MCSVNVTCRKAVELIHHDSNQVPENLWFSLTHNNCWVGTYTTLQIKHSNSHSTNRVHQIHCHKFTLHSSESLLAFSELIYQTTLHCYIQIVMKWTLTIYSPQTDEWHSVHWFKFCLVIYHSQLIFYTRLDFLFLFPYLFIAITMEL